MLNDFFAVLSDWSVREWVMIQAMEQGGDITFIFLFYCLCKCSQIAPCWESSCERRLFQISNISQIVAIDFSSGVTQFKWLLTGIFVLVIVDFWLPGHLSATDRREKVPLEESSEAIQFPCRLSVKRRPYAASARARVVTSMKKRRVLLAFQFW